MTLIRSVQVLVVLVGVTLSPTLVGPPPLDVWVTVDSAPAPEVMPRPPEKARETHDASPLLVRSPRRVVNENDSKPALGSETAIDRSVDPAPEPTPSELWQRWQQLIARQAFQQIPIANARLAESLREQGDPEVYRDIAQLLRRSSLDSRLGALLIELIGEIATPQALGILLQALQMGMDSPLYGPALNAVGRIGENQWDARFHTELSPLLEDAWVKLDGSDRPALYALTRAIVSIGAPSGIALLLDQLSKPSGIGETTKETLRKQLAALAELPKVENPAAVPVLRKSLEELEPPRPAGKPLPTGPPLGATSRTPTATTDPVSSTPSSLATGDSPSATAVAATNPAGGLDAALDPTAASDGPAAVEPDGAAQVPESPVISEVPAPTGENPTDIGEDPESSSTATGVPCASAGSAGTGYAAPGYSGANRNQTVVAPTLLQGLENIGTHEALQTVADFGRPSAGSGDCVPAAAPPTGTAHDVSP